LVDGLFVFIINTFSFAFVSFFFPQLPTLFPPGKGPFASLARVPVSPPPPSSPSLKSGGPFFILSFYFPLIARGLFKGEVVAMGKPHCNYSIWNLRFCTYGRDECNRLWMICFISVLICG